MKTFNFGTLSVSQFLREIGCGEEALGKTIARNMQAGVFSMLWRRAKEKQPDDVIVRAYASIGLMSVSLFGNTSAVKSTIKKISKVPFIGLIRAQKEFHDDIRFIVTTAGDELYVLLDNNAIDNKLATVLHFDQIDKVFVPLEQDLLSFTSMRRIDLPSETEAVPA